MSVRGSYPHPVLDHSDDVGSVLEISNLSIAPTQEDIEIRYTVRSDDPDLFRMLDDGRARHSLRWRCGPTLSSEELEPQLVARQADSCTLRTWIDQEKVRKKVELDMGIVAAQALPAHTWTNQHADYGSASFSLSAGDLLAGGFSAGFDPQKLYDPLDPPIGSCFRFECNDQIRKGIQVSFASSEFVVVQMSPDAFEGFERLGHRGDLQIALTVLPALMETISFIQKNLAAGDEAENLDDSDWYAAVRSMMEANGGVDAELLKLAQKILENPVDRALITGIGEEEDE